MRRFLVLLPFLLAGCGGEAVNADQFANPAQPEAEEAGPIQPSAVPVRIGELGPNFAACSAAGMPRRTDGEPGEGLPLRAAPFDAAAETARLPEGARFFVCSRTHDQRWLGVVFDASGTLSPGCGVSRPITARANYTGPCRSGWAPAAFVKIIAG